MMDVHITDKQIDWFIYNQMNILKECAGAAQNAFNLEVILENPDGFASDMEKFAYAKCRFRGAIDAASDLGIISRESLGCIYSAFNKWKEYKISGKDIDEWLDVMKNVLTAVFREIDVAANMEDEKPEKKMYRLGEEKVCTRYHYVWASNKQEAAALFDECAAIVEDTEFEPEYTESEIEEVEDPDLIQENWPGYILNGDIEEEDTDE